MYITYQITAPGVRGVEGVEGVNLFLYHPNPIKLIFGGTSPPPALLIYACFENF